MMKKFLFAIAAVLLLCGTSTAADKRRLTPDDFDMGRVERIESDVIDLKKQVEELKKQVEELKKCPCPTPGNGVIPGKTKKICDEDGCRIVPEGTIRTNTGRLIAPDGKGGYRYVDEHVTPPQFQQFQLVPFSVPQGPCPNGQCPLPTAPGGGRVNPFR